MSRILFNAVLAAALSLTAHAALAQAKKNTRKADQVAAAQPQELKGDADNAHRNKIAMCIGCHGIPGYKTAFPEVYHVPKIAGQQPGYIVNALKAYKSGERSHPSMRGIATSLTDDDMKKLADYYGGGKK
jgi:cytochrome c553